MLCYIISYHIINIVIMFVSHINDIFIIVHDNEYIISTFVYQNQNMKKWFPGKLTRKAIRIDIPLQPLHLQYTNH